MKASELVSNADLNNMIGRRAFEVLHLGRLVQVEKNKPIDFHTPGLKPMAWDVVANPCCPGDVIRIKFAGTSLTGETVEMVFLLDVER